MSKVLLIEDDSTMVTLLRTLLRFEGYDVMQLDQVDNLPSIMNTIRAEKPDLILLDVHLRHLDGFDLLHDIRKDATISATRVLMSSGMDFGARCLEEGANGFILKPYMPEDLLTKIHQALGENQD